MIRLALLAAALLVTACPRPAPPPATPPPAAKPPPDDEARKDTPFQPVYEDGVASPRVKRLCRALRVLPAERRAACCGKKATLTLVSECERLLGGAESSGALVFDPAGVDACVAQMEARFSTCERVGVRGQRPPAPCRELFQGALEEGAACRSNLECRAGLACHDLGPTRVGTCGAPRAPGERCGQGTDPVAAYVAVDPSDAHPECEGFCGRGLCRPTVNLGAKCAIHAQCGRGAHCADDKVCRAGAAGARGAACVAGRCEQEGDRCVGGRCVEPKPHGAACEDHPECAGRCDFETNTCAMMCSLAEMKPR
jgi:hypothetical protein